MVRREFEVCAETLQACSAAAEGRADRIELCAALRVGGVTPSRGLIQAAVASSPIPVHALLRPRSGNFIHSPSEFRILCIDLEDALNAGATGVVAGLLTEGGEIDRIGIGQLVKLAYGRPVTFHRAFDHTRNLPESLDILADLGLSRVLTSGGKPSAQEGLPMLEILAEKAAGRLRVAAAGGVRLSHANHLLRIPGLDLHASLLPSVALNDRQAGDPLWEEEASCRLLSVESVRRLSEMVHSA